MGEAAFPVQQALVPKSCQRDPLPSSPKAEVRPQKALLR